MEGADFDQFLSRVRRRLLLAEGCSVALRAEDGRTVDSIEGLLEVDESTTLLVASDSPSGVSSGRPKVNRIVSCATSSRFTRGADDQSSPPK